MCIIHDWMTGRRNAKPGRTTHGICVTDGFVGDEFKEGKKKKKKKERRRRRERQVKRWSIDYS